MHLPYWQQVLFYVLTFASIGFMFWSLWVRARTWRKGKPIDWRPQYWRSFLRYVLAQKKVRSSRPRSGAPMHLAIFYGFVALFVATTLLAIASYGPKLGLFPNFHKGTYFLAYEMTFDVLGLLFVVGVGWAIVRRTGFRPKSLTSEWKDIWALVLLFLVGSTGYLLEAARMANNPQPFDWSAPAGKAIAGLLGTVSNGGYVAIWWFHMVWVLAFFASLPYMRIKHIVLAILSASGNPERPMGRLQPITMEEVEQTGQIGVQFAHEYSRWHLLSTDACMECGRCTEVCPAHGVGKVLNPKQVAQGVLDSARSGTAVLDKVTEDAIWACTTCNACVEACPVLIRHVDLIVDVRRNLVAEGKLAGSAANMLRQAGSSSNAWGTPASEREEWMKGLEVPLARERKSFDVLFWVGCAGATDPGAIRTTKAMASLMSKAGVDFACLGQEEACTGDPPRRVGDEFLFQELAQQNVGKFKNYEFKRIVTACPHCFNTLKNEYGDFGGSYEVLHHSQMLAELIDTGKLKSASSAGVAYHDPCYLARVNDEADAPRKTLGAETHLNSSPLGGLTILPMAGSGLLEPENRAQKTLCCGAGGGRMWMEEPPDQRPVSRRAEELLATGAKTIALGCPFCRIMLDAGIKQATDEEIRLVDIAEAMQEANA